MKIYLKKYTIVYKLAEARDDCEFPVGGNEVLSYPRPDNNTYRGVEFRH